MGLRMSEGVSVSEFKRRFGMNIDEIYGKELKEIISEGLAFERDNRVILTDYGFDISNYVFEKFIIKFSAERSRLKVREYMRKRLVLMSTAALLFIIWVIWGNKALTAEKIVIYDSGIPSAFNGFRIVQVSDLHNAEFGRGNNELLEVIEDCRPDILWQQATL